MTDTPAHPDDARDDAPDDAPPTAAAVPAARRRRSDASPWYWLLLVPILLLAWPPLFNRDGPDLGGMPFFYWYQLAVVPIGVLTTAVVYLKTRVDDGSGR